MIQTPRFLVPVMHCAPRFCAGVLVLLTMACSQGGTSTALPRPTTPPSKLVTFSGTLLPQAINTYPVTVTVPGDVEATLVGLAASPTTTVLLGIGSQTASGTCSLAYSVTTGAGTSAQIVGTGLAGSLCVAISDIGNLTGPTIYTITVASS
jgi:hypothetical protein